MFRLRRHLQTMGLNQGFQWIDGSFLEDVELHENRSPRDVDVVTFVACPEELAVDPGFTAKVDHAWIKREFLVDNYFVELDLPPDQLIDQTTYWYSVWSHRRTLQWKGFLQIDLVEADDPEALAILMHSTDEDSTR